jgi:snurportin-1
MYAELLEMSEDNAWDTSNSTPDGLPEDLETGWVAGLNLFVLNPWQID